jgi:hypothetical protein
VVDFGKQIFFTIIADSCIIGKKDDPSNGKDGYGISKSVQAISCCVCDPGDFCEQHDGWVLFMRTGLLTQSRR